MLQKENPNGEEANGDSQWLQAPISYSSNPHAVNFMPQRSVAIKWRLSQMEDGVASGILPDPFEHRRQGGGIEPEGTGNLWCSLQEGEGGSVSGRAAARKQLGAAKGSWSISNIK
ncbi:hypothetical protein PG995_004077 [Apiospora arundinis]